MKQDLSGDLFLGADIGGTKIHTVLIDSAGEVLSEHRVKTTQEGAEALAGQVVSVSEKVCCRAGIHLDRVGGLGIGLPAAICPRKQTLQLIPNIAGMQGVKFAPLVQELSGLTVRIENDVGVTALGEAWLGQKGNPLVFIALGTGIGMGLVMDGKLWRGYHGAAGEIALLPLDREGLSSGARKYSCLEERLGGQGWLDAYKARGGKSEPDLAALFESSDAIFSSVLTESAELLAIAVLSITTIVDPEVICLGGSIGMQPRLLEALHLALQPAKRSLPEICHSALAHRAGAIGAARMVMPVN